MYTVAVVCQAIHGIRIQSTGGLKKWPVWLALEIVFQICHDNNFSSLFILYELEFVCAEYQ